jgi:hypothetical protein
MTLLSKFSPITQISSPYSVSSENTVGFEEPRKQTQMSHLNTEIIPITKPAADQRFLKSSGISGIIEGIEYVTARSSFTEGIKRASQSGITATPFPINEVDVPIFANGYNSSLSAGNIFKPPSKSVSSEMFLISSRYSFPLKSITDVNSVPYTYTTQNSEFKYLSPCHLSKDALCKNSQEGTNELPGSNSLSHIEMKEINGSHFSWSFTSSRSSDITSLPDTRSQEHFEISASLGSANISNFFDREGINSSAPSVLSENNLLLKPLDSDPPGIYSETPPLENSIFDTINVFESSFWNSSRSEDQTFWNYEHRISSDSTPRTWDLLKSLSLVSSKAREMSNISSALAQRTGSAGNDTSDHLKRITVLGLFEMTSRAGDRSEGRSELAAARLAITHVNEKRILPGYQLELITNDTKVTGVFLFSL